MVTSRVRISAPPLGLIGGGQVGTTLGFERGSPRQTQLLLRNIYWTLSTCLVQLQSVLPGGILICFHESRLRPTFLLKAGFAEEHADAV